MVIVFTVVTVVISVVVVLVVVVEIVVIAVVVITELTVVIVVVVVQEEIVVIVKHRYARFDGQVNCDILIGLLSRAVQRRRKDYEEASSLGFRNFRVQGLGVCYFPKHQTFCLL